MDEKKIISVLEHLRPTPGVRFYRRMSQAPWHSGRETQRRRPWLYAAASLLAILVLFGTLPPLQALARGWIRFFTPQESIELNGQAGGNREFALELDQVRQVAGFDLLVPTWLPQGFALEGADFDERRNAVIINYLKSGALLRLTQSMGEGTREIGSIGSQAEVQPVALNIGGRSQQAEYVAGAWRLSPIGTLIESRPEVNATLEAGWDPDAKIQVLRWEFGGILYEIIHGDADPALFTPQIIFKIAEGMQ